MLVCTRDAAQQRPASRQQSNRLGREVGGHIKGQFDANQATTDDDCIWGRGDSAALERDSAPAVFEARAFSLDVGAVCEGIRHRGQDITDSSARLASHDTQYPGSVGADSHTRYPWR
eukprot:2516156-Prymnesium_polylepis.1